MSKFDAMAAQIIRGQEFVIGPLAWSVIGTLHGLSIDPITKEITISAPDPTIIIDHLVARYERLFGVASREVCKDAVKTLIKDWPQADIPASLSQ